MKPVVTLLVIIILLIGFFMIINRTTPAPTGTETATTTPITTASSTADIPATDYVRQNISTLSSIQASLGGTFYVTNIEATSGTGTVKYEDGHMAYIADFTYTKDAAGNMSITSFAIRK